MLGRWGCIMPQYTTEEWKLIIPFKVLIDGGAAGQCGVIRRKIFCVRYLQSNNNRVWVLIYTVHKSTSRQQYSLIVFLHSKWTTYNRQPKTSIFTDEQGSKTKSFPGVLLPIQSNQCIKDVAQRLCWRKPFNIHADKHIQAAEIPIPSTSFVAQAVE